MSNTKLPALPTAFGHTHDGNGNQPLSFERGPVTLWRSIGCSTQEVYSAQQMHAYAEAAILADRERQAGEAVAWLESDTSTLDWPARDLFTMPGYVMYSGRLHYGAKPTKVGENRLTPLFLASLPAPQAVQAEWRDGVWLAHEHLKLNPEYRPGHNVHDTLASLLAAHSPDGKAEQAEAPSDAAREVLAAGIVHHYGVPEEASFACARRVLALATQPTARPEQAEAPSDTLRVACITLDGSTLYIPAKCITDFGIGDDDGETYALTFKTMTRAEYEALGEFDGF